MCDYLTFYKMKNGQLPICGNGGTCPRIIGSIFDEGIERELCGEALMGKSHWDELLDQKEKDRAYQEPWEMLKHRSTALQSAAT